MRIHCLLVLFTITIGYLNSFCQNIESSKAYLTNYTYSNDRSDIGYIKLMPGSQSDIKSVALTGKQASNFTISKDHKLSIRKEKLLADTNWMDIILQIKTANNKWLDTFRIVNDHFIHNKVIAHRGAWKNTGTAENSIASLQNAISLGCEGSEFDVHMSSDSIPFIHHDPDVQSISIAKTSSEELHKIKLSNGESLPTLENYLSTGMKQNRTKLILEIKSSSLGKESSIALTHKIVDMVERLKAQAWVDYISFDYDVCKEVVKLAPYAKVAYLMGDKAPADLVKDHFYGLDYHFSILQKKQDWIKEAKQNNLTVNAWTVNDHATMEWLLNEKVDFITTNEPELLLTLVANK